MRADLSHPAGTSRPIRVAIVGSGIAGLAAAHTLQGLTDITLFEANGHFGGHAHTVDVSLADAQGVDARFGVDIGSMVFNGHSSPNLMALLTALGVPIAQVDMSFSVQVPGGAGAGRALEWGSSDLSSLFAQRGNLAHPRFLRMLADIPRFNRAVARLAESSEDLRPDSALQLQPLSEFLRTHGFSDAFRDWCLLPMLGRFWPCPTDQMVALPMTSVVRLCHRQGLLQIRRPPPWHSVIGGAREYVQKITERIADKRLSTPVLQVLRDEQGVRVVTTHQVERFDAIVLACHSDQALRLLGGEASRDENSVLGAVRFQASRAVLHTDASVLPEHPRAWAAWNCVSAPSGAAPVGVHQLINRLQPLPVTQPLLLSRHPQRDINPVHVLGEYAFEHPVFDADALRAQGRLAGLQGQRHTWFAGAWTGGGFHEDGLKSGLQAARALIDAHRLAPGPSASELRRAALPGVFA